MSFDLYSLRASVPNGTRSIAVWTTRALRSRSRIDCASAGIGLDAARQFDPDRQRRVLFDALASRRDPDLTADRRGERAHEFADRRGEHVDAADDQHVVGPADTADARPGPAARARGHPHRDVVTRPEAQQRGRAMAQVR